MSELNYRFKSPEELRAEQSNLKAGQQKRNRIALLVLLDIGILAIVMAIVYYSGLLDGPDLIDPAAIEQRDRRLSASHKIDDGSCIFYLHIANTSGAVLLFPGQTDLPLKVKIIDQTGVSYYAHIQAATEDLASGETCIVRTELPCDSDRLPLQKASISMGSGESHTLLEFHPPVKKE